MHFKRLFIPLTALVMTVLAVAVWTQIYVGSFNTFYHNNSWIVEKRLLHLRVMGADEFVLSRTPLAKDRLNLGTWFGHQSVIRNLVAVPSEIRVEFQLEASTSLSILFRDEAGLQKGFRLSRIEGTPHTFLTQDQQGKILSQSSVLLPALDGKTHVATIHLANGSAQIAIDNGAPTSVPWVLSDGRWAFKAGHAPGVWIDNVEINDANRETWKEDFSNRQLWPRAALSIVILITTIAWFRSYRRKHKRPSLYRWTFSALTTSVFLFIGGGLYWTVDNYYLKLQPVCGYTYDIADQSFKTYSLSAVMEKVRYVFFDAWQFTIGGEVPTHRGLAQRGYRPDQIWNGPIFCHSSPLECAYGWTHTKTLLGVKRVLFLGSSQTIGAGAMHLEETFFAKTSQLLLNTLPKGTRLETLNAAVSGSNAARVIKSFESHYASFAPNLVVINLGFNDPPADLKENFEKLIHVVQATGAKIVILEEASDVGGQPNSDLDLKHVMLREFGLKYGIPVLPLHALLNSPAMRASGELWWDWVHMNSRAQIIVANWLAPQLLPLLKRP